ncbi:kinesin-like protein KIN-13B, partial [Capsicum annuum]|uniref:kinesin-like protein KIN-13B n=1 Tax=Capsicum annuum TaxID=4072 RepID=UPI0007BEC8B1
KLRVKSLSKGNNSKKEVSSSTVNLKESTTLSYSAVVPSTSIFKDDTGDSWPEQTDKDEYDEDFYEQEKPIWKKNEKLNGYNISNAKDKMKRANARIKWKEPPRTEAKYSNADDDLNALLKEEEDLVNAHQKKVEKTMDIVRALVHRAALFFLFIVEYHFLLQKIP